MRVKLGLMIILISCMILTACSGNDQLVGVWIDSTGKFVTFSSDGTCKNCTILNPGDEEVTYKMSSTPNAEGLYTLKIRFGDYYSDRLNVKIISENEVKIYPTNLGLLDRIPLYNLTRK